MEGSFLDREETARRRKGGESRYCMYTTVLGMPREGGGRMRGEWCAALSLSSFAILSPPFGSTEYKRGEYMRLC